ncbi:MAG: ABC transporter permease [Saprospiraceae bacterium]|nr:ABC transporter permease [Saprospiraceae bacterium]MCB0624898.1 ABC transporter permease [Saprospiraceae bacterium]MCB0678245.1 ABC transporter permease [Saprospiraceae bacterium]MCB0682413.1 ABC transporter permease [Saprospiraceae bacterium]
MNFNILYHFGRYLEMMRVAFSRPEKFSMYWKETLRQMDDIGVGSLVIVCLIAVFMGAVAALQFAYQLDGQLIPMYYIGYIVRDLAIIESAPTITCLVLAGKVGSNIAAEIGGMRQKEHIDAMEIMGVNTAAYLITPKVVAAVVMIPLLVTISAFVAIIGGYLATVPVGYLTDMDYLRGVRVYFDDYNVFMMYVKAVVFSFILTSVSCFQGYYVEGGSIELGKASTNAVVFSNILILFSDYLIAVILT